jgi:phosphate/sulfate permease
VDIIAQYGTVFLIMALIFGLYMTWGIGANDVANAMGTSVGSGAVTVKQAIVIAAIFEFCGAFVAGGHVTKTIRKGIIDPTTIAGSPEILVFGMLGALLAAGIWLMVASSRGWPVSTTHSIVGAVVGFAIAGIGVDAVNWGKIGMIAASWVVSPALGGLLAFLLMMSIRRLILSAEVPFDSAKRWGPAYVFLVGFIISLVTLFKGLKHLNIDLSVGMSFVAATVVGLIVAAVGWYLINRIEVDPTADRDFHFASVRSAGGGGQHRTKRRTSGAKDRASPLGTGDRRRGHRRRSGHHGLPRDEDHRHTYNSAHSEPGFLRDLGRCGDGGARVAYGTAGLHHSHCGGGCHRGGLGARRRRHRPSRRRRNHRFLAGDLARGCGAVGLVFLHSQGNVHLTRRPGPRLDSSSETFD